MIAMFKKIPPGAVPVLAMVVLVGLAATSSRAAPNTAPHKAAETAGRSNAEQADGDFTPAEKAALFERLEKAAKAGDLHAQYQFAELNENWKAGYHNYRTTLYWYRKAALGGHVMAQYRLGYMYRRRVSVDKDFDEAVKWYRMAARQGHARSMHSLGHMYDHGEDFGEAQDYVRAYHWFSLAAQFGNKTSARNRTRIAKWMKPAQIARAKQMTERWLRTHGTEQAKVDDTKAYPPGWAD